MNPKIKGAAPSRLLSHTFCSIPILFFTFIALTAFCVSFSSTNLPLRQRGSEFQLRHFISATTLALAPSSFNHDADSDLTVHEWGTFTSIAGPDGLAMDWLPLTASTDLPDFVEHFHGAAFKAGLRGTIRMETPVLYFYSSQASNAFVNVGFTRGLITEWYPHAASVNPDFSDHSVSLYSTKSSGSISWNSLHIDPHGPTDFPNDKSGNHYYAARQTSSVPLEVQTSSGPQREGFLFYRGVSTFQPPLTATLSSDDTVMLQNHSPDEIPYVILFERRGAQVGYRVLGPLGDQAPLAPPALDSSLESLSSTLEGQLISQGLHPDEAHAMLETWKHSWFEEGSRIIYIVPRVFTDSVLPLSIKPTPAATVRIFVGRLELVTSATQHAVESAFTSNDTATLAKYNRFLEPIVHSMFNQATDPQRKQLLLRYLNAATGMAYAAQ
jgi:hypothetical protein